jgi:hypothetical protein
MIYWNALLLVYRDIDVQLNGRRFAWTLSDQEVDDAVDSFFAFPPLVADLSSGEAGVAAQVVTVSRVLSSLSSIGDLSYWPAPEDTRAELDALSPKGRDDSIFILWPKTRLNPWEDIPSPGWGLSRGPDDSTQDRTYASVGNAPTSTWNSPTVGIPGEVWLHEWLHGVSRFFIGRGVALPQFDADGAESHGYEHSPTGGWTGYYRDLMNGRVREEGTLKGVMADAWRSGTCGRHSVGPLPGSQIA